MTLDDYKSLLPLITTTIGFIGVTVGAYMQKYLLDYKEKMDKENANELIIHYLLEIRDIFVEFKDENKLWNLISFGTNITESNLQSIDKIMDLIEKNEPFITVKLFSIKQSMLNIKIYIKSIKNLSEKDYSESELRVMQKNNDIAIKYITIDSKNNLEEINKCIKHSFKNIKKKTQKKIKDKYKEIDLIL